MSDSDSDTTSNSEQQTIEQRQREKFENELSTDSAGKADPEDLEPSVNDGEELEIANPSDFFVKREGEGDNEISPVKQKIPGRQQAMLVRPFTSGMYEKYLNPVDYDDDEKLAEMFNKAFPGLDHEVTADEVENGMIAYGPKVLVDVIERAAGRDMQQAIENRNIELLNRVEPGKMTQMMQAMDGVDTNDLPNST